MFPKPIFKDALPAVQIFRHLGLEPDPWQLDVLESRHPRILLNCCRQSGKSTVVAVLALVEALFNSYTRVLIVSRSLRQSKELFRMITLFHKALGDRALQRRSAEDLELTQFSRIVCLPCKEETIRGYSHVSLIIIDEAARVPDTVYQAVRPMLAVSGGRIICLSTPYGKRGFFWREWATGGDTWKRIEIPATQCPRIPPAFLDEERRAQGEAWFRQEYFCSFESVEGLVYPDFAKCVVDELPPDLQKADATWRLRSRTIEEIRADSAAPYCPSSIQKVGGMDFGFRNPFAAVWGLVDRDDVLWLTHEHYARQQPLDYHMQFLPRDVMWYADPSGAEYMEKLRRANFTIRAGLNPIASGLAAVTARLRDGTLRVLAGRCPHLLAEAGLYRYSSLPTEEGGEAPVAEHNHALDALRYLLSRLDRRRLEKLAG
jgi:terminase large subunit-like protein